MSTYNKNILACFVLFFSLTIAFRAQTASVDTTVRPLPTATIDSTYHVFTDPRDKEVYPIILIGKTWWFQRNLNYRSRLSMQYSDTTIEAGSWGRYYPMAEIDSICPRGWRLPGIQEWNELLIHMDSTGIYSLMLPTHWKNNSSASNSTKLSLVPSGFTHKKKYLHVYLNGSYWFKEPMQISSHWHLHIDGHNNVLPYYFHDHEEEVYVRRFAVRCICENKTPFSP